MNKLVTDNNFLREIVQNLKEKLLKGKDGVNGGKSDENSLKK